jgi:hypothetical protein
MIRRELARRSIEVIDLRDTIEDHEFFDVIHPNSLGRDRLTRLFAEHLAHIPTTPRRE